MRFSSPAAAYGFTTSLYAVNRSGRQRLIAQLSGTFGLFDVAPDGRLLMSARGVSISLFYQPTVDSKETDLYWHDFSVLAIFPAMASLFILRSWGCDPQRRGLCNLFAWHGWLGSRPAGPWNSA